jgi:arylsulfatase A-like enzyme
VLLIILDDVGAQEIRSYASDLKTAAASAIVPRAARSTGILDTNSNGIPDGLDDTDRDGHSDGAIATPQIDALAAAGVRFTQVWSNPVCSPTRAGVYTGLYGRNHGVGSPLGLKTMISALPSDATTLTEALTGTTYTSGLFGKWHLGESDRPWLDLFRRFAWR